MRDLVRGVTYDTELAKINSFRDEYFFLSNFYEIPVNYNGLIYRNNEAAFQAQKCDDETKLQFINLEPSKAKRLGRKVALRPDWENVKIGIMKEIAQAKFEQNPDIADKLIATGNAYLEEGNTWSDRTWGTVKGKGKNHLGIILMEVREELKNKKIP